MGIADPKAVIAQALLTLPFGSQVNPDVAWADRRQQRG